MTNNWFSEDLSQQKTRSKQQSGGEEQFRFPPPLHFYAMYLLGKRLFKLCNLKRGLNVQPLLQACAVRIQIKLDTRHA